MTTNEKVIEFLLNEVKDLREENNGFAKQKLTLYDDLEDIQELKKQIEVLKNEKFVLEGDLNEAKSEIEDFCQVVHEQTWKSEEIKELEKLVKLGEFCIYEKINDELVCVFRGSDIPEKTNKIRLEESDNYIMIIEEYTPRELVCFVDKRFLDLEASIEKSEEMY